MTRTVQLAMLGVAVALTLLSNLQIVKDYTMQISSKPRQLPNYYKISSEFGLALCPYDPVVDHISQLGFDGEKWFDLAKQLFPSTKYLNGGNSSAPIGNGVASWDAIGNGDPLGVLDAMLAFLKPCIAKVYAENNGCMPTYDCDLTDYYHAVVSLKEIFLTGSAVGQRFGKIFPDYWDDAYKRNCYVLGNPYLFSDDLTPVPNPYGLLLVERKCLGNVDKVFRPSKA